MSKSKSTRSPHFHTLAANTCRKLQFLLGIGLVVSLCPITSLAQVPSRQPSSSDESSEDESSPTLDRLTAALKLAGENRNELETALEQTPAAQRGGMTFLIENMPASDLASLKAEFLLEHVRLAYEAREAAQWSAEVPESIFLNDVLPYANVNEARDDVRRELRNKFWPIVKDLPTISLAAAKLNQEVFKQLEVKYSTRRRRADQGPRETMTSGLASCTGLSILLIDACRACGIPARFVGTPLWSDRSGNHSWVEIWDDGWHFTGAAEPTGDQLDKAWFMGRASKATVGDPRHGIFAVSFQKTDVRFPLVWARFSSTQPEVYCVEVTDRYAKPQKKMPQGFVELQFRALQPVGPDRCVANLIVRDEQGEVVFRGQTRGESSDANDHVAANLKPGRYSIELKTAAGIVKQQIQANEDGQLITLRTADNDALLSSDAGSIVERLDTLLDDRTVPALANLDIAQQPLSKLVAERALARLVEAHFASIKENRREEHDKKLLQLGEHQMPYATKTYGSEPENGHSLYISMHGGGGTTKRVNDGQWKNQTSLYELEEGIYVAPRAPTDTWNLWHQSHIDPLLTRLIENMIVFEGVNPDRVYITGYSAGGDGVFQLAPRMADQLAAAAMMAGHPNETKPDGLRNLPFTLHMGANDGAYNRNRKAAEWQELLSDLHASDEDGYEHWVEIHEGKGHWMDRQDAKGVAWMGQFTRNRNPDRVVWLQDDVVHQRFYWLAISGAPAQPRQKIVATCDDNTITIEHSDSSSVSVLLRDELVDLDQPVKVVYEGETIHHAKVPRTVKQIVETLVDRGDPAATYCARIDLQLPSAETR